MPQPYQSPVVETLGTVEQLTQAFNKVGQSNDMYTALTAGDVVGSVVPAPGG